MALGEVYEGAGGRIKGHQVFDKKENGEADVEWNREAGDEEQSRKKFRSLFMSMSHLRFIREWSAEPW